MEKNKKMLGTKASDAEYGQSSKPVITKEKALMHQSNKKIFIGADFQAELPNLLTEIEKKLYESDSRSHATLMWEPTDCISDDQLDALIHELKPRGLSEDQILAFLCYKTYDIDATLVALNNSFIGRHEGMPLHDKVIFAQGYGFHGKNFDRIADLLPSHSLQTLISHYYTEFKRSKQNKFTATRPEAEVRKLTRDATEISLNKYANRFGAANGGFASRFRAARDLATTSGSTDDQECLTLTELGLKTTTESSAVYWKPRESEADNEPKDESQMDVAEEIEDDELDLNAEQKLDVRIAMEKARLAELVSARAQAISDLKAAKEALVPKLGLLNSGVIASAKEECQKEPTPVWDHNEIIIFMKAIVEFGTDFAKASHLLPTKTEQQVRNMFYNRQYFYGLDKLLQYHQDRIATISSSRTA